MNPLLNFDDWLDQIILVCASNIDIYHHHARMDSILVWGLKVLGLRYRLEFCVRGMNDFAILLMASACEGTLNLYEILWILQ